MKFSGLIRHGFRNNLKHFVDVPFSPLDTGLRFLCFQRNLCLLATLPENTGTDFHKVFRTGWT